VIIPTSRSSVGGRADLVDTQSGATYIVYPSDCQYLERDDLFEVTGADREAPGVLREFFDRGLRPGVIAFARHEAHEQPGVLMQSSISGIPAGLAALTLAMSPGHAGRLAAQPASPGPAPCAALSGEAFPPVATLTAAYDTGSAGQPAHCIVRGSAAPRTGVDGKPYETRFELRLPTDWNGRFLYQGGGGNDGVVAPAVGRNTGSFPDTGLQRGFAVVTTDAGHQGGTAEFGLDSVARVDHAYAAHERTATIALALVSRYYSRPPDRKYFVGCSGGGRQGMMFAQRYPSYFDGIAICAPAMSVSSGATIAAAWDTQTYLSIAPANE
jgi:feruloyl esterase